MRLRRARLEKQSSDLRLRSYWMWHAGELSLVDIMWDILIRPEAQSSREKRLTISFNEHYLFLSAKFTFMDFREIGGRREEKREDNRGTGWNTTRQTCQTGTDSVLATRLTLNELFTHTHTPDPFVFPLDDSPLLYQAGLASKRKTAHAQFLEIRIYLDDGH